MARRDKLWSSAPFLLSRDKRVRWHAETNYGHLHPLCYLETSESDGTRRQIMVIYTLFVIQRQVSLMAREDKLWSSIHLCYLETIKSNGTRRQIMVLRTTFAIQRQSSPMARRDKLWSFAAPLLSRDNQVRWHTEADYGHLHLLCHPETIKSDGTQR